MSGTECRGQGDISGRKLSDFTDMTKSAFLLSPLLVKKGDRPSLIRKPKAQRKKSSPGTVFTAAATVAGKPYSPSVDIQTIKVIFIRHRPDNL